VQEVTVDDIAHEGLFVLDVREGQEYVEAHVPGAVLIPMGQVPARIDEIPNVPVYVICRSGNRSRTITELLLARGFEAYNVAGGTMAWIDSGRAVNVGTAP
jgi:rhodanese-related sulfurtransferase